MKKIKNFLVLFLVVSAVSLFAQPSVGDYHTVLDSTWNAVVTWNVWDGSAWTPATNPPTGSENITILNAVNINVTVSISGYVIMSTGGDLNITTGSLTFTNGSTYEHAINSGSVPIAIWGTGSTCKFTGVTSQAPGDRNQSYYNLIWNCPSQSGNLNMGFNNVTIGGDINVISTGASSRWYLCGPVADSSATVSIMGDLIQTAGQVSSNGSGNGGTTIIIHQYGDLIVSNGNFSISRGSQGGTGTTSWYLHGTNFSMTNIITQNSNPTGAKFIFAGTSQQNLILNNITYGTGGTGGFPLEVAPNAILDVGLSQVKGSGIFTFNDAATLHTSNSFGLDSTLQTTGMITLSTAANYTFNGTSPQVTGNRLPVTVNNFTVNNSQGVTPSHDFTANGNLTLTSGDLHLNGGTITLGPLASLIESAGNTVTDVTGKIITVINLNSPSGLNVAGMGVMITTTADLGSTIIERYHFSGSQDGESGIFRVFNIIPANNTGLNATLRYYFDESELNGLSEASLRLFKSTSGANNTWTNEGGSANASGNYVELSSVGSFSYWTLFEGATTFQLTVNVANGWNMVSVPGLHPIDQNVGTWWTHKTGTVWGFNGSQYVARTVTTPGEGYWMKNTLAETYNYPAITIVPHTPIPATLGWNMLGGYETSPTITALKAANPQITGTVWGFNGSQYVSATNLVPGYSYWVKTTSAGNITIPDAIAKGNEVVELFKEDWGKIILTDAAGLSYTLYSVKGEVDLSQYEMPPLPPAGMFDIRFNSGRIAENLNSAVKTIDMSGVTYPLTVRVEGMDIRLMDETGKTVNVNLKDGEDVVINEATINKLMVSGEMVPSVYALEQNYPNPFNPSTVIEFSLPENVGNVKLSIYNALGEKVAELVNTALVAGNYSYQWNAQNVATGMYVYELRTDKFVSVKKMMLMK